MKCQFGAFNVRDRLIWEFVGGWGVSCLPPSNRIDDFASQFITTPTFSRRPPTYQHQWGQLVSNEDLL